MLEGLSFFVLPVHKDAAKNVQYRAALIETLQKNGGRVLSKKNAMSAAPGEEPLLLASLADELPPEVDNQKASS